MTGPISRQHFGILLVIVSSILFAFVPNTAKIALDDGTSLFFLIVARYAIGAVLLLPFLLITRSAITVPRDKVRPLIVTSILALLLLIATYHAVDFLDVGLVLLILYSFPIGVALLAQLNGRESISMQRWLCMATVLLGLGIMMVDGAGEISLYGVAVSFAGLICFVFFIDTSGALAVSLGSARMNLYLSLIGLAILAVVIILPLGVPIAYPASLKGHTAIFGNGVFYILSWVMFFEGARIIGATRASLMACVEPLFAALLAMAVLDQFLSATAWFGFLVVLASIFMFEKLTSASAPSSNDG